MWSECSSCGTPVVLDLIKEEAIITASEIGPENLDETCAILLSHCPKCVDMHRCGPADAIIVRMKE